MANIVTRSYTSDSLETLISYGIHPVLARVYAARGIREPREITKDLSQLIPFWHLKNISEMAALLADAIVSSKHILIVADYDVDGATACAVGIRGLRKFGAIVNYLVPNRFEHGYGLTPEIVRLAANLNEGTRPDILITVDNGIASIEGVEEANRIGIQVFITDHHLPGDKLPNATSIVNPNQLGCDFPSKNIAGVGVMFYLMLALRAEFRSRGRFLSDKEPNLANLLDLVALGTIGDVVKLDMNNRILVQQGLYRIRNGRSCAGVKSLFKIVGKNIQSASTSELGFILGPRLNAAGRLDDMSIGIECLITDNETHAMRLSQKLDELNSQRRAIEINMQDSAELLIKQIFTSSYFTKENRLPYSIVLYDSSWHQGVIGILASRIKDKFHRPVIIFSPGNNNEIKGSGRSIPGFHLRDALDAVSKSNPSLLLKFGGHAAAAGLTIYQDNFDKFKDAFEKTSQILLTSRDLLRIIETDGDLNESEINIELAHNFAGQVWGQGFPYPIFNSRFKVKHQYIVGGKHLKLKLRKIKPGTGENSIHLYESMLFFYQGSLPEEIDAVYRLNVNEYSGNESLQLILDHWKPV